MPLGRLLVGVADTEETALAEGASQELESHWEIDPVAVGEPAGETKAADAGEVRGNRKDIGQVHLEGVISLLTETERYLWGGRGDDGVDLGEGLIKIASDQGADLLGLLS